MKKTAIVLSVVFLVGGFIGVWSELYLEAVFCFVVAAGWVGLKIHMDHKKVN